jgi:hypothetical protein
MKRKIPKSKKIPGKAYLDYELARSFPIWEKLKINPPTPAKVPENSIWVIHWWRENFILTPTEQIHLEVLRRAKGMFKRVILFYASNKPLPDGLDGITVVPIKNDPSRGENISFLEAVGQALKGQYDYVFRSHFKGKKAHYDAYRIKNIIFWNKIMYDTLLNIDGFDTITYGAIDCIERHWLDPHLASLPGKVGKVVDSTYQNHYAGSFYWINCAKFKEFCKEKGLTFEDFMELNGDEVQGKPWLCEVLLTALTKEINAKYQIDFSPYYQYDWWVLNGRPTRDGFPVVGKIKEEA